jgi:hypothetical protein
LQPLSCGVVAAVPCSRHFRQQSGGHPRQVRRRQRGQRDREQRGERVPGHRGGVADGRHLPQRQGQTVQGETRKVSEWRVAAPSATVRFQPGLLRDDLLLGGGGRHHSADAEEVASGRRRARGTQVPQVCDVGFLLRTVDLLPDDVHAGSISRDQGVLGRVLAPLQQRISVQFSNPALVTVVVVASYLT